MARRILGALVALVVLLCAFGAHSAALAATARDSLEAVPVSSPPPLDATLADPAWQNALHADSFLDLTTRRPAPLQTQAYLLYDSRNLYVGFKATQQGVPITATQTTNNVGFGQDDFVAIGIDTTGGGQVYYFETTPRGVLYQQSSESSRFAPPWRAVAQRTADGWNALMVIPLKDLRGPNRPVQTWRINFLRGVAASGDHYTWAYDGIMADGQPPNFPTLTDYRFWPSLRDVHVANAAVRPQPRVEIYGLASAGKDRNVFQQTNGTFAAQSVRNYGIDLVYPLTNSMAFVGTLAPDFSNVEVDQTTIAPQEFQRNLAEYRPFFAQGAGFFNPDAVGLSIVTAPNSIFYTPSIGAFDRGAKIEGTFGQQQLGLLETKGAGFDDVAYGFKHALADRTFLWWTDGVLANHIDGRDFAREFGLAGRDLHTGFVWGANAGDESGTFVPDASQAHTFDGFVDVHKPNYEVFTGYHEVDPYFAPVDGFTVASDVRGPIAYMNLVGATAGVLKSWSVFAGADRYFDRSGAVREADISLNPQLVFKGLFTLAPFWQVSELRSYACEGLEIFPARGCQFGGDPVHALAPYAGGVTQHFVFDGLTVGYRDGTPSPVDVTYSSGPFGSFYLNQFSAATTHPLGARLTLGLELDGTRERPFSGGQDSQTLRRITLGDSFGPDENISISYRSISGTGGFAAPGRNLAVGYHRRFSRGSELFVAFGTPAAPATLDRVIVKYLWRIGGGAGT